MDVDILDVDIQLKLMLANSGVAAADLDRLATAIELLCAEHVEALLAHLEKPCPRF